MQKPQIWYKIFVKHQSDGKLNHYLAATITIISIKRSTCEREERDRQRFCEWRDWERLTSILPASETLLYTAPVAQLGARLSHLSHSGSAEMDGPEETSETQQGTLLWVECGTPLINHNHWIITLPVKILKIKLTRINFQVFGKKYVLRNYYTPQCKI